MVQSLRLGEEDDGRDERLIRRVNRLPILFSALVILLFLACVFVGLSWRGLDVDHEQGLEGMSQGQVASFGDQLKRGVSDGIIGEPDLEARLPPVPVAAVPDRKKPGVEPQNLQRHRLSTPQNDPAQNWKARLEREQDREYLTELHRQRMYRLQARATALDAPIKIEVSHLMASEPSQPHNTSSRSGGDLSTASQLYAAAVSSGLKDQVSDPNGQRSKEAFFEQNLNEAGYLPNRVTPQTTSLELKRGSVIPATLMTGVNSDLPGRVLAQVSQNVYDSASGYSLLIPQGTKLLGRYDSKISFGQRRVLVAWTDLVFPNGATLQIGGMSGADAQGNSGFKDRVDRHRWQAFGSAALIAVIGAGIDMAMPESSTLANQTTASDAVRRNFAESFGRVAEQSISKGLSVQPTLRIRPGYIFNVIVDQDIIFPEAYPS